MVVFATLYTAGVYAYLPRKLRKEGVLLRYRDHQWRVFDSRWHDDGVIERNIRVGDYTTFPAEKDAEYKTAILTAVRRFLVEGKLT